MSLQASRAEAHQIIGILSCCQKKKQGTGGTAKRIDSPLGERSNGHSFGELDPEP